MRRVLRAVLAAAVTACEHGAPPAPPDVGSEEPFAAGSPIRLTYNAGADLQPSWLPDGSGLLYSFERLDRRDRDRCLGLLPPGGGRLTRVLCNRAAPADDSTDAYEAPSVGANGLLAYQRSSSRFGALAFGRRHLVVAPLAAPAPARVLLSVPYTLSDSAGRRTHFGISQIRWLGDSSFVYLGEMLAYRRNRGGPADTITSGVDLVLVRLNGEATTFARVPGTAYASSVAAGGDRETIYYTLGGDTRVYRRSLSTGATTVVYDFGAAGIARDVQVAGSRLVAVVGGAVSFGFDPDLQQVVQRDSGGDLHVVDLVTGSHEVLAAARRTFRHPALSPSGSRVVAEGAGAAGTPGGVGNRDLWRFDLPLP